jgi:nitrate reductase cytochrome c-type subunit
MSRDRWRMRGAIGAALLLVLTLSAGVAGGQGLPAGPGKRLPRAYEGAPPLVPHDVEARKGLCQECHTTGEGGAPITPHPTRTHFCIQCHVGQDLAVRPFEKARAK